MCNKSVINLYNRYGDKVWLEHQKDKEWLLKFGAKNQSSYMRIIYDVQEDGTHLIKAVDPSGGPFLCIGYVAEGKTVTKIEAIKDRGYVVTLEDLHKNETDRT